MTAAPIERSFAVARLVSRVLYCAW